MDFPKPPWLTTGTHGLFSGQGPPKALCDIPEMIGAGFAGRFEIEEVLAVYQG